MQVVRTRDEEWWGRYIKETKDYFDFGCRIPLEKRFLILFFFLGLHHLAFVCISPLFDAVYCYQHLHISDGSIVSFPSIFRF